MKSKLLTLLSITLLFIFSGCEKDNYKAPDATITGRVVYQNLPLGVRSDGVQLELYQPGYAFSNKIPVYVKWDGTFSVKTFSGNYKLTRLKGNGPWADNTDTINVQLNGTANVDVPVDPFFIVKNETFTRTGTTVTATFNLQRINTSRALELVRLYIGKTIITDQARNEANGTKNASAITDLTQPVTMTATIPAALANNEFVFVRVGVKAVNTAEYVYTMPLQLNLK